MKHALSGLVGLLLVTGIIGGIQGNSAFASPRYKVISDLDDTLKLTRVESKIAAVYNGFLTRKAFAGGAELLNAFAKTTEAETIVMSASPKFMRGIVEGFLRKHGFPASRIILKNKISDDTYAYKMANLIKLAQEDSAQFILIGDDSEHDAPVYVDFANANPGKVAAIYIRKTYGHPLPAGATGFSTSFEPAVLEQIAGRLSVEDVKAVGLAVLTKKKKLVLPRFASCASPTSDLAQGAELNALEDQINVRVEAICKNRLKDERAIKL